MAEGGAGAELDQLVAERVMDYVRCTEGAGGRCNCGDWLGPALDGKRVGRPGTTFRIHAAVPCYSQEVAAAWQVVEALRARGYQVTVAYPEPRTHRPVWHIVFDCTPAVGDPAQRDGEAEAATVPLAVCRAALAVLQGALA